MNYLYDDNEAHSITSIFQDDNLDQDIDIREIYEISKFTTELEDIDLA